MPARGDITSGNNEVAGIGTTSLTHQEAIQNARPAVRSADTLIPAGGQLNKLITLLMGPAVTLLCSLMGVAVSHLLFDLLMTYRLLRTCI